MVRETSLQAYQAIKENGLLSQRRLEVYEMLFKDGPLTIAQTREQFRRKYPNLSDSSVSSRFSELERRKVIKRVGLSLNPHTGLSGILWDVTSGLPEKPVEITKDQRKASIRARLNIIAQWVPDFVRSEIEAIHVQLKQL